jgi:hypothetical protein
MADVTLRDILINARQESFRMHHYFLGVEHLFIGMLEIQGGLTRSLIESYGLTTEYVIDAIRRKTGKGTATQRMFAGMPYTPRADMVMSIANDLSLEAKRSEIGERELFEAILEENDNIPVRVLARLGLTSTALREALTNSTAKIKNPAQLQPLLEVDFGADFQPVTPFSDDHYFILRRLFHGYSRVRVDRQLTGGYSASSVLAVTPINGDSTQDSPVVVKIDHADTILDEAQRYEAHVKSTLPPLTARLEDKPAASETTDMAGLKYTFIADSNGTPQDLSIAAAEMGYEGVGKWIKHELYPTFGKTWWMQRRPYRFQVWTEYDWLLPPLLTLEYTADNDANIPTIKDPIRRDKIKALEYGDPVAIENFTVHRVHRDKNSMVLTIGRGSEAAKRAYKIEVRGLNLAQDAHFRGEVIERLTGRVWKTRDEMLLMALTELVPDFDPHALTIPGVAGISSLPNPLSAYPDLLDRYVNGSLSKIHGDLHLGNILVGHNHSAFLIDFAQTRSGHVLFDWACLEISLLDQIAMPEFGDDWAAARQAIGILAATRHPSAAAVLPRDQIAPILPIAAVRDVVNDCLTKDGDWSEYFIAVALCGLRAATWDTMSPRGRRAAFILSAYAVHELSQRQKPGSADTFTNDDETDAGDLV